MGSVLQHGDEGGSEGLIAEVLLVIVGWCGLGLQQQDCYPVRWMRHFDMVNVNNCENKREGQ